MPIRAFRFAILALLVSLPAVSPSMAQVLPGMGQPQPSPPPEQAEKQPSAPPAPVAIDPARVPERAEQSRATLRKALQIAEPLAKELAISPKLPEAVERIASMAADPGLGDPVGMDFRSLEGASQQWQGMLSTLNDWQGRLTTRSQSLAEWHRTASWEVSTWKLTAEELRKSGVGGGLVDTAKGVQEAWQDADRRLKSRQGEVLAVQGQLNAQIEIVEEKLARISEVRAQARLGVLRPDYEPLWRGVRPLERQRELPSIADRVGRDLAVARNYVQGQQTAIAVHFILTLAILAVFVAVRQRVQRLAERREDLLRPLSIFRRPVAAALALSLMAFPWVYPDAPPSFREVVAMVALIPVVVLLPLVVAPSMRKAVYLVAGLFLLVRFTDIVSSGTTAGRVALLVYAAAAGAAAAWFFRPGGAASKVEGGRYWRSARAMARLAAVLFFISAALNIIGFVSLADLLAEGTLLSAFLGLLMLVAVSVTGGVSAAILFSPVLQISNMARWNGQILLDWIIRVASLGAAILWILGTLRYFRIQEPVLQALWGVLTASAVIGSVSISLGDIIGFMLAILGGLYVSRFLRFVLNVEVFPRVTLPRGVPATIVMLLNYTVLGLAFVLAVAAAGIDLTKFALIAGALSVGIGFGLQNVVNNFVSGLILAFERPVQAGDAVQVGDIWGEVRRIGVRSSTVRTWSGAEVIVPNADLISNQVTNWTLSDRQRRMEIAIGVAYGTNPHQVIELATQCAKNNSQVLSSPEPRTIFTGFGESSLDFELRAWTEEFDNYLATKSELLLAVHDALYAAGIEIPFPQRDLHLRSVDGEAASRLTGRAPPQPPGPEGGAASGAGPGADSGGGDESASDDAGDGGATGSPVGTSGDGTSRGSA